MVWKISPTRGGARTWQPAIAVIMNKAKTTTTVLFAKAMASSIKDTTFRRIGYGILSEIIYEPSPPPKL